MERKLPCGDFEQHWRRSMTLWNALDEHGVEINRERDVEFMRLAEPMSKLEMRANAYLRYRAMVDLMTPTKNWQYGFITSAKEARREAKPVYQDCMDEYELRNRMCGQDVIRVYARQGTTNWSDTDHRDYADKPWYAGSVDDGDDSSYAHIYVRRIWVPRPVGGAGQ